MHTNELALHRAGIKVRDYHGPVGLSLDAYQVVRRVMRAVAQATESPDFMVTMETIAQLARQATALVGKDPERAKRYEDEIDDLLDSVGGEFGGLNQQVEYLLDQPTASALVAGLLNAVVGS